MEQIKTLRKRIRAIWKQEEDSPPQVRKLFQWQMLAYQNGIPYVVGKADANTFFYQVGSDGVMEYVMPDKMFEVMDSWCSSRYLYYSIAKGSKVSKKLRADDPNNLLKRTHDKYAGCYIVGVSTTGVERLYKLKQGLTGNMWVKQKV